MARDALGRPETDEAPPGIAERAVLDGRHTVAPDTRREAGALGRRDARWACRLDIRYALAAAQDGVAHLPGRAGCVAVAAGAAEGEWRPASDADATLAGGVAQACLPRRGATRWKAIRWVVRAIVRILASADSGFVERNVLVVGGELACQRLAGDAFADALPTEVDAHEAPRFVPTGRPGPRGARALESRVWSACLHGRKHEAPIAAAARREGQGRCSGGQQDTPGPSRRHVTKV
jgi:hypothetical protein